MSAPTLYEPVLLPLPDEVVAETIREPSYRRGFLVWGGGAYLVTALALLVASLRAAAGHLVYPLDDAAIHLSVAQNLAHHGTWGVVPGEIQSASSSPLWTVLLGGWLLAADLARHVGLDVPDSVGPLLINLAAGLWVVAVLAGWQRVLAPGWRRILDAGAAAVLVVVVLFLPALSLLGMEHTLHVALVLSTTVLFARRAQGHPTGWPAWLPYLLLALASLVRLETVFLAAGLALAELVVTDRRRPSRPAGVLAAGGLPFVGVVLVNQAAGQGWLPNSVVAKVPGLTGAGDAIRGQDVFIRFTNDPLLGAMTVVIAGLLLVAWRRPSPFRYPAVAFAVAVTAHVFLARVGYYERYQAYLIAVGVLVLLAAAADLVPPMRRPPARAALVPGLIVVSMLTSGTQLALTADLPAAATDTYQQRYQAARFLARYYDGRPVATGELGYISLLHRGPLTDMFGVGDHEVLEARKSSGQRPEAAYWADLARRRGFRVAAVYRTTMLFDHPDEWTLVGEWTINRKTISEPVFQFWATTPDEIGPLTGHLREYDGEMPVASTLTIFPPSPH
jgi:hypothetical protein